MAISASYRVEMSRALPGQVSDTSAYNIDGACVLDGDVNILVGVAVQHGGVDAMGNKKVKPMAATGKAYGVAIRSHFQTTSESGRMIYEVGSGINVMTEGRVWMLADADIAVAFDGDVKLDENGQVSESGEITTSWKFTGDKTKFQDLFLVEVKVKPAA